MSGVIQNAPSMPGGPENQFYADYYITGIDNSPFAKPNGGLAAAVATTPSNMTNLMDYMSNNSSATTTSPSTSDRASAQISKTAGTWEATPRTAIGPAALASSVENRIYAADQAEVSTYLAYQGTKIVDFGYSPLYEIIDYGATTLTNDDSIAAYSDAVSATAADGLAGDDLAIALALIADVSENGGLVQLYFDTIQAATYTGTPEAYNGTNYLVANYQFSGAIMVVPEPSTYPILGKRHRTFASRDDASEQIYKGRECL